MPSYSGLEELPTDVFSHITRFFPLHAAPSTLLSLALVNRKFYEVCYPLLYSQVILRNEKDTQRTIFRILTEPVLGLRVKGLHIMSGLSQATRRSDKTSPLCYDAIRGLEKLISNGVIPNLTGLSLHLLTEWRSYQPKGYGVLPAAFWIKLTQNCPGIKSIILSGLEDIPLSPWIPESGIYELREFNCLEAIGLNFFPSVTGKEGLGTMSRSFGNLSASLHTLSLDLQISSRAPISFLHFPNLRRLSLSSFHLTNTPEAMLFWNRHPKLERISLSSNASDSDWFADDIPLGFLQDLKYLEASYKDVIKLAPLFPQLNRLGIWKAAEQDVPNLLRYVKPLGLSRLKSLEIQVTLQPGLDLRTRMGNIFGPIRNCSPNLEEIGLHSGLLNAEVIFDILCDKNVISGLDRLERIYLSYMEEQSWNSKATRRPFFDGAFKLAQKGTFRQLQSITNFSSPYALPYPVAKLLKNEKGNLMFLDAGEGFGMEIGNNLHPFPGVPGSG